MEILTGLCQTYELIIQTGSCRVHPHVLENYKRLITPKFTRSVDRQMKITRGGEDQTNQKWVEFRDGTTQIINSE